jgi:hypothetical protein
MSAGNVTGLMSQVVSTEVEFRAIVLNELELINRNLDGLISKVDEIQTKTIEHSHTLFGVDGKTNGMVRKVNSIEETVKNINTNVQEMDNVLSSIQVSVNQLKKDVVAVKDFNLIEKRVFDIENIIKNDLRPLEKKMGFLEGVNWGLIKTIGLIVTMVTLIAGIVIYFLNHLPKP